MTDPLGQSQVLPYLRGLSKEGYTFHLVSYEKPDRFHQHKKHIQKICDESGIVWHPQDYAINGSIKDAVLQIRRMKKVAHYLHHKYDFKIVHCRSYISALVGLDLKRKKGLKFIFDMRGFWANERVDGKIWNLNKPIFKQIFKFFKRKEIQFFKEADHTISLTENGKNEILSWKELKGMKDNITVIPCCVDLDLFDPTRITSEQKSTLKKELNIHENQFVLGYIGSIGTWYMLPEMLQYYSVLREKRPEALFLFVSGENPESIYTECDRLNIPRKNIRIVSSIHKNVPLYTSLFDASIFFIQPSYSKKASSPTKQGEIMAMGIPLICNSNVGDTDKIVKESHAGIVIDEFTSEVYHSNLIEPTHFDNKNISEGALKIFSLQEGTKKYLNVYRSV